MQFYSGIEFTQFMGNEKIYLWQNFILVAMENRNSKDFEASIPVIQVPTSVLMFLTLEGVACNNFYMYILSPLYTQFFKPTMEAGNKDTEGWGVTLPVLHGDRRQK